MIVQTTATTDVDFIWQDVVVGADLDAVEFAYDNKYFLIKNRQPHHHSYEEAEEKWAEKIYQLYDWALAPFTNKSNSLRVVPEDKLLKVFTDHNVFVIKYENLYVFDNENVEGFSLDRELLHYRVVDWFDCQGIYDLSFDEIVTEDNFVQSIKFFKTCRIDGNQRYLDLLCESSLTDEQLKSFDYSDTMARFKVADLLKKYGVNKVKMSLWKRDIFPIYKAI
jgi:hypothetical protein